MFLEKKKAHQDTKYLKYVRYSGSNEKDDMKMSEAHKSAVKNESDDD